MTKQDIPAGMSEKEYYETMADESAFLAWFIWIIGTRPDLLGRKVSEGGVTTWVKIILSNGLQPCSSAGRDNLIFKRVCAS